MIAGSRREQRFHRVPRMLRLSVHDGQRSTKCAVTLLFRGGATTRLSRR